MQRATLAHMKARDRLVASGFEVPGRALSESRYFEPTERVPHPEWWHATDGDSSEIEVGDMLAGLVRVLQPELVVETGAAFGVTSFAIGMALRRNSHGVLHAIEHDELRAEVAHEATSGLPVAVITGSSLDYKPTQSIGLLFSDSNVETRVPEFLHLLPWLMGAVVVFHDARPATPLRDEIERCLVWGGHLTLIDLPTPRGCVLGQVASTDDVVTRLRRMERRLADDDAELRRTVPV